MVLQLKSIDAEAPLLLIGCIYFEDPLYNSKYFYRKLDKKHLIF